jgi:DNA-directed RNA polymerases I and III subunit RPAC1
MLCSLHLVNIESEGPYAPERLLIEAISVMRDKIAVVREAVANLDVGSGDGDVVMG